MNIKLNYLTIPFKVCHNLEFIALSFEHYRA